MREVGWVDAEKPHQTNEPTGKPVYNACAAPLDSRREKSVGQSARAPTLPNMNYDKDFFQNIENGSRASAEGVLPIVQQHLCVRSVVDFGCGNGVWLNVWKRLGTQRVLGLDGAYVDPSALRIATDEFMPADLGQPIDLHETFDLVQSLEVAEHIPSSRAEVFVDNLVRHGRQILFSAAVPGQLGVDHVNERGYEYWRRLFAKRNYSLFDAIRPAIRDQHSVKWWYRYNLLLFVEKSQIPLLATNTVASGVKETETVPDFAPLWCQAGRCITRFLSVHASTTIAHWFLSREGKQKRSK